MKKIFIEGLGFAKNQVDSETRLSLAKGEGSSVTSVPSEADVIVINTCVFIKSAKEESVNTFFQYRNAFPERKVVLAGCLAQRYFDELELPEADAIFGNHDLSFFPQILKDLESSAECVRLCPETDTGRSDCLRTRFLSRKNSAYLKISEGCNHRCNYCAIPVIRGPLVSRKEEDVLADFRSLLEKGIYEINIVAQDLGAYGTDWDGKEHFTALMHKLAYFEGNFVLRMLYIHPGTFPLDMID